MSLGKRLFKIADGCVTLFAIMVVSSLLWCFLCWLGNVPPFHFLNDIWEIVAGRKGK